MNASSMGLMKRCTLLFTILGITLWVALCSCATVPAEKTAPLTWEVYFSPKGGCTDVIVRELDKASITVLETLRKNIIRKHG